MAGAAGAAAVCLGLAEPSTITEANTDLGLDEKAVRKTSDPAVLVEMLTSSTKTEPDAMGVKVACSAQ